MFWHKDANRKDGGFWKCIVKKRAADARYKRTDRARKTRTSWLETEAGRRYSRIHTLRSSCKRREVRIMEIEEELNAG